MTKYTFNLSQIKTANKIIRNAVEDFNEINGESPMTNKRKRAKDFILSLGADNVYEDIPSGDDLGKIYFRNFGFTLVINYDNEVVVSPSVEIAPNVGYDTLTDAIFFYKD